MDPALLEYLKSLGIDENQLADMAYAQGWGEQSRGLERDMGMLQQLRGAPQQGQMVGKFYVPPSPFGQLAQAATGIAGAFKERGLRKQYDVGAQRADAGRQAMLRMTLGKDYLAQQAKANRPPAPTNLGRLMAERDALPPGDPRRDAYDQAIAMATSRAPPQERAPHFTFLQSGEGYLRGNARTGEVTPVVVGGKAPLPPAADPALQGQIAGAKAGGKVAAETAAQAQADLPRVTAQAEETLRLTEELLSHPGFKQAVGTSSVMQVQKIPGTDARDFMLRLDQLRGKQFLEAFQSLKGGGQITEVEGRKATEAIARMDIAASEEEFVAAVRDFQQVVRAGLERVKNRAAPAAVPATAPPPEVTVDKKAARRALAAQMKAEGASAAEILEAIKAQGLVDD